MKTSVLASFSLVLLSVGLLAGTLAVGSWVSHLDDIRQDPNTYRAIPSSDRSSFSQGALSSPETRDAIVLFFEFPDRPSLSKVSQMKTKTFPLVIDYFIEASYGRIKFNFVYAGPKAAPRGSGYYSDNLRRIVDDAVETFDDQATFSQYDHIVVVNNGDWLSASGSVGEWDVTTDEGKLWLGVVQIPETFWGPRVVKPPASVVAHELYHNIGALPDLHQSPNEAGRWDIMDEGYIIHTLSYFKTEAWLGWLPKANVEIIGPGTFENYTIYPLEEPTDFTQALRIPLPNGESYLVEVRKNTAISDGLPEEGVVITHVENTGKSKTVRLDEELTKIWEVVVTVRDAETQTATLDDAAYEVGDQFKSEEDNLQVEVISKENESFKVRVMLAAGAPELLIISQVPWLQVQIDGKTHTADENGKLGVSVWPGWRKVNVPSEVKIDENTVWVFIGWSDGKKENSRSIEVISDTELRADYEVWKYVTVEFVDGFGSPIPGVSISGGFDGENIALQTDENGRAVIVLPLEEQEVSFQYFGQEKSVKIGADEFNITVEMPYTPLTTAATIPVVAVFLILLYLAVSHLAPESESRSLSTTP